MWMCFILNNFKIMSILNNCLTVLTNLLLVNVLFLYLFIYLYQLESYKNSLGKVIIGGENI